MKILLRLSLFCVFANWVFGAVYGVVYVRVSATGTASRDSSAIPAIKQMVSRLNAGATNGNSYKYVELGTFTAAKDLNNHPNDLGLNFIAANIYHGVFSLSDLEYTGNVQDQGPDSTPEDDVDPYVDHPYHCGSGGLIDTDEIAADITQRNGGSFPPPPANSGGGGGGGSGGGGGGSWSMYTYEETYTTFRDDPNWPLPVMVVHYATVTVWIWTPTAPDGGNYLALNQLLPRKRSGPLRESHSVVNRC